MGNYNDFDLNIKNIQTQKEDENLRFTSIYTCGDSCSCGDTCYISHVSSFGDGFFWHKKTMI